MISVDRIRTELNLLYSKQDFRNAKNSLDLYQFILQNNLQDVVFLRGLPSSRDCLDDATCFSRVRAMFFHPDPYKDIFTEHYDEPKVKRIGLSLNPEEHDPGNTRIQQESD